MTLKRTGLLAMLVMLAGAKVVSAGDDGFDIAMARDLPGKSVRGECLTYAEALYSRISRAGGEAHLVTYAWSGGFGNGTGSHAVVVYRDKEGRYWGMDNQRARPLWLKGANPESWGALFFPNETIKVTAHTMNPALIGRYADLSRAPFVPAVQPVNFTPSVVEVPQVEFRSNQEVAEAGKSFCDRLSKAKSAIPSLFTEVY